MIWSAIGRYVIGAAAFAVAMLGVWLYGDMQYKRGHSDCQAAAHLSALEQFKRESEKLTGLSDTLARQAQELAKSRPQIIERYTRVEVEKPLPAGCVLDAERMRILNAGIEQANSAAKSESAMPTDPGSQQ